MSINERPSNWKRIRESFVSYMVNELGEDNLVCSFCGELIDLNIKHPHPKSCEVDHILPISRGGNPSDFDNLQLLHRACNEDKGDKILVKKQKVEKLSKTGVFKW